VRIDRYTQYRVIAVTDPRTNKQPQTHIHTGPITIHCAPASAQRNDMALPESHEEFDVYRHWTDRSSEIP